MRLLISDKPLRTTIGWSSHAQAATTIAAAKVAQVNDHLSGVGKDVVEKNVLLFHHLDFIVPIKFGRHEHRGLWWRLVARSSQSLFSPFFRYKINLVGIDLFLLSTNSIDKCMYWMLLDKRFLKKNFRNFLHPGCLRT